MKKDKLKEIAKYSKEEILEALGRIFAFDQVADSLLTQLEYDRRTKAIEAHRKSMDAENAAFDAYINWQKQMIAEYGDGERVYFNQVPADEIQRGTKLEKAWMSARKKEQQLDAKVTKLLEM